MFISLTYIFTQDIPSCTLRGRCLSEANSERKPESNPRDPSVSSTRCSTILDPRMFLFSWCASPVSNDLTDDTLEPVKYDEIQGAKGESPVEGLLEVGPASSTRSGSSRASGSRLQSFLESLNDLEKVESEAISLMTSELGQRSFLVEVNEVIHKKPLCRTGHCQISTAKWHGQRVAVKELMLGVFA